MFVSVFAGIYAILAESAVYLLAGFALAGLLHVVLSRNRWITRALASAGSRSVFLAALFGLPLPLCSCSVLPAALTIRRGGASKGATASFLISVPETDVVSILLTYALLGPFIAVYRPVAALVTAIATGLAIDRIGSGSGLGNGGNGSVASDPTLSESGENERGHWMFRALRYGFVEVFDDIILQLIAGIVVAGALVSWLPEGALERFVGGSPAGYLIMLAIGIPAYVCAAASTPVAVGMIMAGVSPGAAMVFLLAGPATNIASVLVLGKHFGKRLLALYLGCIGGLSIAAGVVLDRIIGTGLVPHVTAVSSNEFESGAARIASVTVFGLITLWSLVRTRPWSRLPFVRR